MYKKLGGKCFGSPILWGFQRSEFFAHKNDAIFASYIKKSYKRRK